MTADSRGIRISSSIAIDIKDLWSMTQLSWRNVSMDCHLATCKTNFQLELLSTLGRQDIVTASIFHLGEALLANVPFITAA